MARALVLVLTLIFTVVPARASEIKVAGVAIDVKSFDVESTKSLGGNDRGPALAVLKDGTVLLGGGTRGGSIFTWNESNQKLKLLGEMISKRERIQDSRFAVTDIAVLSENKTIATLLISFPRLAPSRCVEVVVFRAT